MIKSILRLIAPILALQALSGPASPQVIYDNTSPILNNIAGTQLEIGDEVIAAGTARKVTKLEIGVFQQGEAGTADFIARLYANNGAGGAPGTLLWQSALIDDYALTGLKELLTFAVPSIEVPDVFTWTLQISDSSPVAVQLTYAGPPTVGGSPPYAWFGSPGSWGQLPDADFTARVTAAPESSSWVLLLTGALGVLAALRRGRSGGSAWLVRAGQSGRSTYPCRPK